MFQQRHALEDTESFVNEEGKVVLDMQIVWYL